MLHAEMSGMDQDHMYKTKDYISIKCREIIGIHLYRREIIGVHLYRSQIIGIHLYRTRTGCWDLNRLIRPRGATRETDAVSRFLLVHKIPGLIGGGKWRMLTVLSIIYRNWRTRKEKKKKKTETDLPRSLCHPHTHSPTHSLTFIYPRRYYTIHQASNHNKCSSHHDHDTTEGLVLDVWINSPVFPVIAFNHSPVCSSAPCSVCHVSARYFSLKLSLHCRIFEKNVFLSKFDSICQSVFFRC